MTNLEELSAKLLTYHSLAHRYAHTHQLSAALNKGVYRRVVRGAYMHSKDWERLTAEEQYLARIVAQAASTPDLIFSHHTAAILHGLPYSDVPETLHVYSYHRTRAQGFTVHHGELYLPTDTTVFSPGIRVTSLERTLADLADRPSHRYLVSL